MSTRREFLKQAALASTAATLGTTALGQSTQPAAKPSGGLNLLILGGTGFLGPHVVETALARGHSMTLFNRGKTNTHLFPKLEKLRGDRDPEKGEGLSALEGREWDAVIDTSAYYPRVARASSELLAPSTGRYVFVSTVSVYASHDKPDMDESAPVGKIEDETTEKVTGESYGPLKALCEQAVEKAVGERSTIVRPGLIVGPRDNSDRFTYWPLRVRRGGEILAPGNASDPAQWIDVRDLAEFLVTTIEKDVAGTYNAVGPEAGGCIGGILYGSRAVTGGDARMTWVDADFLASQEVAPWGHMPVWVPAKDEMAGFGRRSNAAAREAGLSFRPLADTVQATLTWWDTLPEERRAKVRSGISPKREAEVLAAWHARDAETTREG